MHRREFSLLILTLVLPFLIVYAGNTGRISGKITDEKTGEPVVAVNVLLQGTSNGGVTDPEGSYLITNIPPGNYSLAVSGIGFGKKIIQNIQVNADFTTRIDVKIAATAVDLEPVVVTAERPLVRADLTSSHTSVDASQIRSMPVENIAAILSTQAGIIEDANGNLHFRGGRSDEVSYTVNGVSMNDPFTNTNSITIATIAIQELSVVQGTFNAEYGNALSGVVETSLREGGEKYSGQVSVYTGDRISNHTEIFQRVDRVDPLSHTVVEGSVGGPLPELSSFSFFLSGRWDNQKGWLFGKREHRPSDMPVFGQPWVIPMSGSGSWIPMNTSTGITLTNRFAYKLSSTQKIGYDFIFNEGRSRPYSHLFRYNPDGRSSYYSDDVLHALEYINVLNPQTTFRLKGSFRRNRNESYRYKDLDPSHYEPDVNLNRPVTTGFYFGGAVNGISERKAETFQLTGDVTMQLSKQQELKAGFEAQFPQLFLNEFVVLRDTFTVLVPTIPDKADTRVNSYTRFPKQYSGYAQTKLEYESIIMNLGLRYDYFIANALHFIDIYDVDVGKKKAKAKQTVSPRIGVSYPITDRGIIHFSYGHFFQMPQLLNLYENPDFKFGQSGTSSFGNADLNPQKTVTYEFGLQQQLSDNLAFNVTGFYKDVRDLFAVQTIRISNTRSMTMYVNKDYGNIKGVTVSLIKRRTQTDMLAVSLDYSYQVAEGNDIASASAFFIDRSSGRESEKIIVYLNWDQTHTLNGTLSLGMPSDWNISVIGKLGSGLPYTPYEGDNKITLVSNSGRKPMRGTVDLLAQKEFLLGEVSLTFFLKVFNLFDQLNEINVYSTTGTADAGKVDKEDGRIYDSNVGVVDGIHSYDEFLKNPGNYSDPREVMVGCSLNF